jgi:VanZ family protein
VSANLDARGVVGEDAVIARRWVPALACAGVILVLTSIPNPGTLDMLTVRHLDKVVHFAMYGGLGFLLARALLADGGTARALLVACALGIAFGAADEWHQQFVPGRSTEVADLGADALGCLTGAAVAALAFARRRQLETHS